AATKYSILVNGTKINAEVKIIDGTTYVPLRAVSEALGATVSLNQSGIINIISSTNKAATPVATAQPSIATPTATPQPTQSTEQATRTNPANIAEVIPFTTTGLSDRITGNLSVLRTIRGSQAWKMIYDANKFNSAPKDGYEYILASIKIDIVSNINADNAVSISPMDFTLVSSKGVDYSRESVVVPDPEIRTQIYAGGSQTGWVAFLTKTDDPAPLIVYGRKYNGSSGLWFKTN
ncbi:DUF4352 domain-containing protein, partial [Paenibacillus sp. HN-1]